MALEHISGPCVVCGEELDPFHQNICMECGQGYHLRMTENAPEAKDCGVFWIDDDLVALVFCCNNCRDDANSTQPIS